MKVKRFLPTIAIAMTLALGACTDAVGPTGQNPDVASVLEDNDDASQDTQGQQGKKKDRPLEP